MERVTATVNGNEETLDSVSENTYQGSMVAPIPKMESAAYPLTVTAVGDNGAETEETRQLLVENSEVFPMEFIAAKPTGEEIDYCREGIEMDLDLGDTNDFELRLSLDAWTKEKYYYDHRIFIPGTEYGGIIDDLRVITASNEIVLTGQTWRGMLTKKIVQPPDGQDHLILSGDLNDVLRDLIGDRFAGIFVVPAVLTGVEVYDWQVDRYVELYDAIMKLLDAYGYRLQISYIEPEGLDYGYVSIQAVPVTDYSDQLEYSQDGKVHFDIRDYRGGINHLICVGEGQNRERVVLHLYVLADGSIGKTQYYTGLQEKEAVYDFSSADIERLEEDGTKRLKELQNYKSIDLSVDDIDLEIGDIVGGYEEVTGTRLQKPVTGKIIKVNNGQTTIEYKVKGDD